MKHYLILASGLFSFFLVSLGSAKFLDDYSRHYVICTQDMAAKARSLTPDTLETANFLKSLKNNEHWVDDTQCPSLFDAHKTKIRALITDDADVYSGN